MVNRQARALLGRPVAEVLGANAHDLLQGADDRLTPHSTCRLSGVLEHGRPARGEESTFLRGDGRLLPVSLSAAPILEGGQVLGLIVAFRYHRAAARYAAPPDRVRGGLRLVGAGGRGRRAVTAAGALPEIRGRGCGAARNATHPGG
ncbi:PAS domain-containing protein [Microbispora sp. NBRC 16548]|uniref:PAS domain-containing protein n=1 Tax=Microbispora sp. NBRC 16548 TaxID=3030994 RepID=UPI00331DE0E3